MAASPIVRFLSHGAERSGPPIYLLRLLRRWNATSPPLRPEVVLARPGPLAAEFAAVAPTRVAVPSRRSLDQIATRALLAGGGEELATPVRDAVVRARCGRRPGAVTVVNGATQPTADLLRALRPDGDVLLIAHELSTGWFHNVDAGARDLLLSEVDRYLAVSRCVADFLREELGIDPTAISIGRPPVEPAPELRSRSDDVVRIGGGGVLDWRKAPDIWLRIAHRVLAGVPPDPRVEFTWIGGTEPCDRAFWPFRHEMEHLGLSDRVRFTGDLVDPTTQMERLDLFVSTAREDAYPLMCVEAAAHGVPVVSFDGGGAEELIREAGCGVVVTYPDDHEMAATVAELVADPTRRAELGAAGRTFARTALDPAATALAIAEWITDGTPPVPPGLTCG